MTNTNFEYAVNKMNEKKYDEAEKYFKLAAEENYPAAGYMICFMYDNGFGDISETEAKDYCYMSKELGYEDAVKRYDMFADRRRFYRNYKAPFNE